MNKPRRHHYLPISYLDGFTNNDKLWIFDREQKEYRQQHPINTALVKNLNTYTDQFGEIQTIEPELAAVEGSTKAILTKLDHKQPLSASEKETLALFVSLLWVRVPAFSRDISELGDQLHKSFMKKLFGSEEHAQKLLEKFPPERGNNLTAKDIVKFVQAENYNVFPNQDDLVTTRIPTASIFSEKIIKLDWLFFPPPKMSLLLQPTILLRWLFHVNFN